MNIPDPAFQATYYVDPSTNSYRWIGTPEVTDQAGEGGQNSTNPQSLFNNHQIVKVITKVGENTVTTFYDPSYGLKYTSLNNMEATVVAGYFKWIKHTIGETEYDAYAIRTNDLGGHLVASYYTY